MADRSGILTAVRDGRNYLATEVFLGDPGRFANSNKVASYMTFVST
jgi:hypothetical protein